MEKNMTVTDAKANESIHPANSDK